MTLNELINTTRLFAADLNAQIFNSAAVLTIINLACKDIYRKFIDKGIYLWEKSFDITFTADNQEIIITDVDNILPKDIFKINRAFDEDGREIQILKEPKAKLQNVRSIYIKRVDSTDPDKVVSTRADVTGWFEIPSSTFIITVWYSPIPIELTDRMNVSYIIDYIPEAYHDLIPKYAASRLWASRGISQDTIPSIDYWANEFENSFNEIVDSLNRESVPDHVIDVQGD